MSRSLFLSTFTLLFACRSDKGVTAFNSRPEATITSHSDGDTVLEGYVTTFRGSASDPNHTHDRLSATWYVGTEVLCDAVTPESDGLVQCVGALRPGDAEVTLEVKDAGNATGSSTVNLMVTPTDAPESQILTPQGAEIYYSDQLITFTGMLSDTEDLAESLTGYWESGLDGVLSNVEVTPNSEGEVEGFGYLTEGEHAIQLHVEDTTGKTGSSSIVIDVGPPNSSPLCEILSPETASAGPEGELVLFTGTISDVDVPSDWLSVTWFSDKDDRLGDSTPNSNGGVSFPYEDLTVNTHVISMVVTDEIGASCTADTIYTVGTPPVLSVISPTQNDVYPEGGPITFEATVYDNEDQPTAISFSWDVDGSVISTAGPDSTGSVGFVDSGLGAGSHTLTVTATDIDGLYATEVLNFSINGLPSAPSVTLSPNPATTTSTLNASASGSVDPEGAAVGYSFLWLQNGQSTSQVSSTLPSSVTTKGETWTVRVTPDDGISNGPFTEESITIQNTVPTVSNVVLSPTIGVYNDIAYTCTATATDPDEVPVLGYQWTLSGTPVGTNSDTIDLNGSGASPDDLLVCTVTATDGDQATASGTATVIIENRPPVLSNMIITPSAGVTTSTSLTCTVDITDDDGEMLSPDFSWTVGTNTYPGANLLLDPSMVAPNDAVTCTASVIDGYGGSDVVSVSVTVDNTPPVVTGVTLTPSLGVQNSDGVTCSATYDDADNDSVTLSYSWTVNGNPAGVGASITLSAAVDDDLVECTATALDANGDVGVGTASLTVENTVPVVSAVSIVPSAPTSQTPALTCSASGSDVDGDMVGFSYEWLVGTQLQSETSDTFAGPFSVASVITCRVTPDDNKDIGASVEASVMVDNTPPTVSNVTLAPSSVYTNDTVIATAVFDDVDGQTVSGEFEWHVIDFSTGADTIVQSGPDNTLSGANHFDRDDSVYVVVTPNDTIENGTPLNSALFTVMNSVPEAPSVSLSPNPAIEGQDDLVCVVTPGTDVDFDSLFHTYEWRDPNGLVVRTTTRVPDLSDTLSASSTSVGTWSCEVVPYDGTMDGPSASTTTVVETGCASLEFNGVGDFIEVTQTENEHLQGDVTIEAWYYGDNAVNNNDQWLFAKHQCGYRNGHILGLFNGQSRYVRGDFEYADGVSIQDERWHHVSYTTNSQNEISVFLDGMLLYTSSFQDSVNTYTWKIAAGCSVQQNNYGGFPPLYGMISSMRISNVIRYSSDFVPAPTWVPDSDTVALWEFNTQGGVLLDQSGNGYDGSINGATLVDRCPEEDNDGDGVAAWEDCDDSDPTASTIGSGSSAACAAFSCKSIIDAGLAQGDGRYWVDPLGSGPSEVYCDMTTDGGGWALVGVALFANRGQAGWNDDGTLSQQNFGQLNDHWHYDTGFINALSTQDEFRAVCFNSTNNYTRYWYGVSDYKWSAVTAASSTWDGYPQQGSSYATSWASHHYGLVSGNNETETLITSHSGNEWACGGSTGPNGEGFTGRGGISNFRLWVK